MNQNETKSLLASSCYFKIVGPMQMYVFLTINRIKINKNALAGNRTRAARVAGEHSTTEPPVLVIYSRIIILF
jgi:hypothetical protein